MWRTATRANVAVCPYPIACSTPPVAATTFDTAAAIQARCGWHTACVAPKAYAATSGTRTTALSLMRGWRAAAATRRAPCARCGRRQRSEGARPEGAGTGHCSDHGRCVDACVPVRGVAICASRLRRRDTMLRRARAAECAHRRLEKRKPQSFDHGFHLRNGDDGGDVDPLTRLYEPAG
jgi:hypothetical protein